MSKEYEEMEYGKEYVFYWPKHNDLLIVSYYLSTFIVNLGAASKIKLTSIQEIQAALKGPLVYVGEL